MTGGSAPSASSGTEAPPPGPGAGAKTVAGAAWRLRDGALSLDRPRIMAVLNLTPDSFSDGGEIFSVEEGLLRAEALVAAGADVLDVGGESTRPGAREVPAEEEMRRILPFLRAAAGRLAVPVSVDTRKARVARAAAEAGASIVNDVSGLRHDPEMAGTVAELGLGVVIMHMRGTPETMRRRAEYEDVAGEVAGELRTRVGSALEAGVRRERIAVDPGIGFAKTAEQSMALLRETDRIAGLGFPVVVGPSRKSFLGAVLGAPPRDRLEGTLAACAVAYLGGARVFRVHDVEPVARFFRVLRAIEAGGVPPEARAGEGAGRGSGR